MIKENEGRFRSERSIQEQRELLKYELERMSADEREALEILLSEMQQGGKLPGQPTLMQRIEESEYKRKPVDMRTFVLDEYFLGNSCYSIYPRWLEDLEELFSGGYQEAVFTGSIGSGKCTIGSTEIFDTLSGRRRTVSELGSFSVLSMDSYGKLISKKATAFRSGSKPCMTIELATGNTITLSKDHPVFTGRGWIEAENIVATDYIATPRSIGPPEKGISVSDNEVKFIAYMLADGGCTERANITFTNETESIINEMKSIVSEIGVTFRGVAPGIHPTKHQNSGKATSYSVNGAFEVINKRNIRGHSRNKRIPAEYYGLNDSQIAIFINRFWACDGYIGHHTLEVTLASEGLIRDLQFLLLRLGIPTRYHYKESSYVDNETSERRIFDSWRLTVEGKNNITKFFSKVGPILGKEEASSRILEFFSDICPSSNVDIVPITGAERLEISKELMSLGSRLPKRYRTQSKQCLSRSSFIDLCDKDGYSGKYSWLAKTDLMWSRISRIYDAGIHDVYDLSVSDTHSFVGNNIVVHNTFAASVGICRILYELSCMSNPHRSFGIAPDSNISIAALSVNETLAVKVVFENIATKLGSSPYFKEHFPFEVTKKEMRFPNNIWVAARATTDTSALGLNLISSIIDESNYFHQVSAKEAAMGATDRAETIHAAIKRRIKNRFEKQGRNPGMIFVVSSKKTSDDFTAKRIRDSKTDPTIFVRDYAVWDVAPDRFKYSKWFSVLVGNESTPSKILEDNEVAVTKSSMGDGCQILRVPEDFRQDFESDLEGGIRDIGGVATVSVNPFISRREKITEAIVPTMHHPFSVPIYDPSKTGVFMWDKMVRPTPERGFSKSPSSPLRPILNPRAVRHVHIDPSVRGDATGICMAHIGGFKDVQRRTDEGETYMERAPIYVVDLILKVVPPVGDEIVLAELRQMVYALNAHGYTITHVSLDQFQSEDSIQTFNTKGFNAEKISVDITTAPYDNLKTALYENRVQYYQYDPLIKELQQLERRIYGRRVKVDHPLKGEKDCSDALAGVCFTLSKSQVSEPLPIMQSMSQNAEQWMDLGHSVQPPPDQSSDAAVRPQSPRDPVRAMLPAFIVGNDDPDGGWNSSNGGWGSPF